MTEIVDLFRKEAVLYRQQRSRSENQLPLSNRFATKLWTLIGLLSLIIALMFSMQYRETESARGQIVSGIAEQQLVSPKPGILQQILINSGDKVSAGQVVAVVSLSVYSEEGQPVSLRERDFIEEEIAELRKQKRLLIERHEIAEKHLSATIEEQISHTKFDAAQSATLRDQLEISESLLTASEALLQSSSIAIARFKQQELEHLGLVRTVSLAEQKAEDSQNQVFSLRTQVETARIEHLLTLSQLDQNISSLVQRLEVNDLNEKVSIVAIRDGTVATIAAKEGEAVLAGQAIVYLHPNEKSFLGEVYVPSSIVARLYPGQELMIRYDAFDFHTYGRYPATIKEIGGSALDPREHLLPVSHHNEPLFPVLITPAQHYVQGEDVFPLQAGLLLEADFITAEMSLIEFIFKPMLNLKGKVI